MNDSDESVEIKQQVSPFFNVQETITSVYIFDRDRWVEREGERGVETETETDRHEKGKTLKQKKRKGERLKDTQQELSITSTFPGSNNSPVQTGS